MTTLKDRLVQEDTELIEKISLLVKFKKTSEFQELEREDRIYLNRQLEAMRLYQYFLRERVRRQHEKTQ